MSESSSDTNSSGFEVIADKDLSEQEDVKDLPIKGDEQSKKNRSIRSGRQPKIAPPQQQNQSSKQPQHKQATSTEHQDVKTTIDQKDQHSPSPPPVTPASAPTSSSSPKSVTESLDLSKVSAQLEEVRLIQEARSDVSPGHNSSKDGSEPSSPSLLSWLSQTNFLNKVKEKAQRSVDTMITTLDPGMKEYLYSGGDINIVVASDKDVKVSSVREAFQDVFGRATVKGFPVQCDSIAAQPYGFEVAQKGGQERISCLRAQTTNIPPNQVIIAIESFIAQLLPESWYNIDYIILDDPLNGIKIELYTQATPVPSVCVNQMKFETSSDYPHKDTGFAITLGSAMATYLKVDKEDWHQNWHGIPRKELIYKAAFSLANLYKTRLNR